MLPRRLRVSRERMSLPFPSRAASPHFSLSLGPAPHGDGGCSAVVSKKVARLSTGRHLLKRRMLMVLRPWCDPSRVIVVYARAGSGALSYRALADELEALLARSLGRRVVQ